MLTTFATRSSAVSEYHSDYEHYSKTMLSHFHGSTHEFWRYYVARECKPPQPKGAVIGSICHDVLLLGKQLGDVARLYPSECLKKNGAINPKPAREWESSLGDDEYPVKQPVFEQCSALLSAIRNHDVVRLIESASARERVIRWTDDESGMPCRMMADFFFEDADDNIIYCYDLKFTQRVKPNEFWRTAAMFRYWLQDAHYSNGLASYYDVPVKFVFWAVEDSAPFRVARYQYTDIAREAAQTERADIMRRLKRCIETDQWEDDWTQKTNDLWFTSSESQADVELDWEEDDEVLANVEKPF